MSFPTQVLPVKEINSISLSLTIAYPISVPLQSKVQTP